MSVNKAFSNRLLCGVSRSEVSPLLVDNAAKKIVDSTGAFKIYTIIATKDIQQWHFLQNMDDAIYPYIYLSIWARHSFQGVRGYNQEQQLVYADFNCDGILVSSFHGMARLFIFKLVR